jgi:hypothetical protein
MTHGRNTPTGWAAFCAFRQTPAPLFVRRHGNWRHGYFAKFSREGRRHLRLVRAALNGRWIGPLPCHREPAPGWAAYRAARRMPGKALE